MNKSVKGDIKNALQKSYIIIILLITSLVIGFGYHHSFVDNPRMKEWQIEKFQSTFIKKEKEARSIVSGFVDHVKNIKPYEINNWLLGQQEGYHKKGYSFYIYKNDTIAYWSTNFSQIPFTFSSTFKFDEMSIELGNAIYYSISEKSDGYVIVCLIKIKDNYSIQNHLLKNEYGGDFKLSNKTKLNITHCLNCVGVNNQAGKRIFSIEFNPYEEVDLKNYRIVYLLLLTGVLLLFILFIIVFTRNISDAVTRNRATLIWIALLFLLRLAFLFKIKNQFFDIEIFNPSLFAASDFLSSLGDLILHAICFFVISILFYENFEFKRLKSGKTPSTRITLRFFMHSAIIFALIFWFINIFNSLILNSNISFEIYKVLKINTYTVFAIFSVVIIFIGICVLYDKFLLIYIDVLNRKQLIRFTVPATVLFILSGVVASGMVETLFISVILMVMFLIRISGNRTYNLSRLTLLVFLFSSFSVYFILKRVEFKQYENKKVLAVNLATEHDYIAEMLLENISTKLKNDKRVFSYLTGNDQSIEDLQGYINSKYFGGYLGKYKIQVLICTPYDSIYITPDNRNYHCYSFFSDYVGDFGISVPKTGFYFMNNVGGRIGYLGTIIFNDDEAGEYTLFIELQSKLVSTELGYPELLIGSDQQKTTVLKDYSYAKYNNNELIAQSGSFQYPLKGAFGGGHEFEKLKLDGYGHVVYFPDDENVILISSPTTKSSDILFTFSYLFLFYMLSMGFLVVFYKLNMIEKLFQPTFRNKIQFSMILVLIISLVLIGGFTIYYSARQYKSKHYELISEKLQSVQIELEHKLSGNNVLTRNWDAKEYDNLDELLRKFSNVFFSDIHLYDPFGNLLASSRPEIFSKNLQGSKMNPGAYYQLTENNKGEFIHNEEIGTLRYLSGYVPFFNQHGDLLAYLNLPYFTRQKVFTGEITSLVIAVLNIYVLLFLLTIALAFIMSEQITRPLKLIQDSFKRVKLGIQNEVIQYAGEDEIAGLINEYNRMVVELSENAEKLARSQREMAWREMARQIAHEIKNPLTPMKLHIQQLQRAWDDKAANWGELLNKVASTLIEQINALSSIATEFSNFAKMPQPKNEVVNVIDKLKNTVSLFEQTGDINFKLNFHNNEEINIYADKEQILRMFTNLIKNAIQSIPEGKKGKVTLNVTSYNDGSMVKIEIRDNGRGIPEEIHKNLFQPNFTTKSGGMGLGLAIVKKIVDTTHGNIYFTSEVGKGTCFTIEWEQFR